MKILMLPAWFHNKLELGRLDSADFNSQISFFAEQADTLNRHTGLRVDILMPKIYSVTKLPRLRSWFVNGIEINQRKGGEDWIGYYPYLLPHSRPRNWRHFGEKLFENYIKKNGMPDVLWSNGVLWSAFLANHLHHKYKLPYFILEHQNLQVMDSGTKKSRKIKSDIVRLFEEAFLGAATCQQSANRMKNFLGDAVPDIGIVTNIIAESFENIKVSSQVGSPFIFHNTARLDDNKNHTAIINAFAEFNKKVPDSKLTIAGEGINFSTIKQQIKNLHLDDNVILLGYLTREGIAGQLLKSSAFICASHSETFNITLIEALACGLPCVSTPAGVAEDAINELNGIVVASIKSCDILKGMFHVYDRYLSYDPQQIRREALHKYDGAALATQLKNYFKRIDITF